MKHISSMAFKITCMFITFMLKILKLRINTENFDEALSNGDIFVFNHFTRFETALPQYILYCLNNNMTYAIAHAPLFKIPVLGRIIKHLGAVPHNHPNLLPLLTERLSQGYKVVIFPQGRMVKDHEDIDMKTGSAILALATDLYKRHVKANPDKYDEKLVEFAQTKTLIVPGNISYYPLRTESNDLSKLGKKLKLPGSAIEELTIEGNLILRDTDMNLNFAEPIRVDSRRIDISGITCLEDCYETLKNHREDRFELKDSYNDRIYKNLKINHGHIFSEIIFKLRELGLSRITKYQLKSAMEISCEDLDLEFSDEEYKDLIRMSMDRKLLIERTHSYMLSLRIDKVQPFQFVRMTNPLKVYHNELSPMAEAREVIAGAIQGSRRVSKRGFVLTPKDPNGESVLIVHGLFATADQGRVLAEDLQSLGYIVHVPLICGHGTNEADLAEKSREDWYESVKLCVPEGKFHVVGFSTGGLIAARIAAELDVLSLTTICAPMDFIQKNIMFSKVLNILKFPKFVDNTGDKETYNLMPIHTLSELLHLTEESKAVLKNITVKTLITQASNDPIVEPESGKIIQDLIPNSKLVMVESERHNMNDSKEIVLEFIRSI